MKTINIGVDVGNYDTKTPLTTTPSGFSIFESLPFGVTEYLQYKDHFYVPYDQRFPYVKDKTKTENAFVLTLIAIGKEIIAELKEEGISDIQKSIYEIEALNLCVGLPPAHMQFLKEKTIMYYKNFMGSHTVFQVNGYTFRLHLNLCEVVPQDFAAIAARIGQRDDASIPNRFEDYYAIDIGGATVDVVPIRDGVPMPQNCISLELGILKMYDKIMADIDLNFGVNLSQRNIENVLRGKNTIIDKEIIDRIYQLSKSWINMIFETLIQKGIDFVTSPCAFIGGGSLLFKHEISESPLLHTCEIIGGAKANAIGYTKYIKAIAAKS